MNSPADKQQEDMNESSLEDALASQFDEMTAETEEEETDGEEIPEEESEETTAEADEESEEEFEEEGTEGEITEETEVDYDEPAPERWPDELKEAYAALTPQAKKAMIERIYKPMQRQYTKSTQEISQMRGALEPMLKSFDSHKDEFIRMGINPVEAFERQMAWAAHLAVVGPEQGLKDMSAAYGLDKQPLGQDQDIYMNPVERQLRDEQAKMRQELNQMRSSAQEQQQQTIESQKQQWANEVQNGLQSFMSEQKDGKPLHPHVEKVAPAMAGIIRGGLVNATDDYGQLIPVRDRIAQAYQMACDLDPSIRTVAPRKRQVAKARAAQNVGTVTNHPSTNESLSDMTLEDALSAQYDRLRRA